MLREVVVILLGLSLAACPFAAADPCGATRVHPAARAAFKLMGVASERELAEIIVSVGLAQNLGALRALATGGIQRGHMGLHARARSRWRPARWASKRRR